MPFLQGIAKVNSHSLVLPLCCYNPNIKPFYFFSDFNVNFAFISRLLLLFFHVIFLMFRTRKAKKRSHTFCWFWCVFHCQSVPTLTLTNPKKNETTHTKLLLWMSQEAKHARTPRSKQSPVRAQHSTVWRVVWKVVQVRCHVHCHRLTLCRGLLQFQFCKLSLYFDLLTQRRDFADIYCCHLLLQGCKIAFLARFIESSRHVYYRSKWRQPSTVMARGGNILATETV